MENRFRSIKSLEKVLKGPCLQLSCATLENIHLLVQVVLTIKRRDSKISCSICVIHKRRIYASARHIIVLVEHT